MKALAGVPRVTRGELATSCTKERPLACRRQPARGMTPNGAYRSVREQDEARAGLAIGSGKVVCGRLLLTWSESICQASCGADDTSGRRAGWRLPVHGRTAAHWSTPKRRPVVVRWQLALAQHRARAADRPLRQIASSAPLTYSQRDQGCVAQRSCSCPLSKPTSAPA